MASSWIADARHWFLRPGRANSSAGPRPLLDLLRPVALKLPLVGIGSLIASLLEGAGLALLLPLLTMLTGAGGQQGFPRPLRTVAAQLAGHGLATQAAVLGLVIVLLIALKGAVQIATATLVARLRGQAIVRLQSRLLDKLMVMQYRYVFVEEPGRLTKIANADVNDVADMILAAGKAISNLAFCLILGVMLLYLDWRMVLIIAGSLFLLRNVFRSTRRKLYEASEVLARTEAQTMARSLNLIRSLKAIRIFGRRDAELRQYHAIARQTFDTEIRVLQLLALLQPQLELVFGLLLVATLAIGISFGLSFPEISLFLILVYRLQPHLRALTVTWMEVASKWGSVKDVEWMLGLEEERSGAGGRELPPGALGPIEFDRVSYAYPNGNAALTNASFVLPAHGTVALLGPSGSGKSTIINLLCRFMSPQAGCIRVAGGTLEEFGLPSWRERISVAGQDVELSDGTVAYNIGFGKPDATLDEIVEVARLADAHGFIEALPDGYDTLVGTGGLALSGGQRQRIGIARALLKRPSLLIFDEATNAVDLASDETIMRILHDRTHFDLALVVSHRQSTIAACDTGIVLRGGTVVETGELGELRYAAGPAGRAVFPECL